MTPSTITKISPNGRYLAIVAPDGCLKIWESATRVQKLEYIPPSNLVSPITALAWVPLSATKKSNQLAFGTASGWVLLFSLKDGEMKKTLPQEHQSPVTGLAWDPDGNGLYSASEDKLVLHWDLTTETVVARWNDAGVCALTVVPDPLRLIAAQPHSLILWSLPDHTAIRTLGGHTRPILHAATLSSSLVVTAAQYDSTLCIWDLDREASIPAASLKINGEPLGFAQALLPCEDAEYLLLAVWTLKGFMHVFHCKSHFKKNKPIFPKTKITLFQKGTEGNISEILPILAAHIYPDGSILVAYGSYLSPVFEKLTPDLEQKCCSLMRKIDLPLRNADQQGPKGLQSNPAIGTTKKAQSSTYKKDQPILPESLADPDSPYDHEAKRLIAGLQSMDLQVLDNIFDYREEDLIKALVDRLTTDHLIPIFTYLTENYVYRRNYSCWVRCLYFKFAEYLLTEIVPQRLVELIEEMVEIHERTPRLKRLIHSLDEYLASDPENTPEPFHIVNNDLKLEQFHFETLEDQAKPTICQVVSHNGEPRRKKRKH